MTGTRWRTGLLGLAAAFALSGCGGGGQDAGDSQAQGVADGVTRYLRDEVVNSEQSQEEQIGAVRGWLAAPTEDYIRDYGTPTTRVLPSSNSQTLDVVFYAYGKAAATQGGDRGWGYACRRFSVDSAKSLVATKVECPPDLARSPSPVGT